MLKIFIKAETISHWAFQGFLERDIAFIILNYN